MFVRSIGWTVPWALVADHERNEQGGPLKIESESPGSESLVTAGVAVEAVLIRLSHTYGSTPQERELRLPGDEIVPIRRLSPTTPSPSMYLLSASGHG